MTGLIWEVEQIMNERFGKDTVITYGLFNKMRQISKNPVVAIADDWSTAHGRGVNLGYFGKDENAEIARKLLFSHGTRYDIDFDQEDNL